MGDKNTKFFYTYASQRKKKNQINTLTIDNNQVVSTPKAIDRAFIIHFQNLSTSSCPSVSDIDECLVNITPKVSAKMNNELTKPFTLVEIHLARHQMEPRKSPSPDGINVDFY